MTASAIAEAIYALAPAGVNKHRGVVAMSPTPALPWLVVSQGIPAIVERSLASTAHANVGDVLLTVAGTSEASALWLMDRAIAAYEGARPVVTGWVLSPLERLGDVKVFPDDVVIANVNTRVMVAKATFRYTATRAA